MKRKTIAKKEKTITKMSVCTLMLCAALCLGACGSDADGTPNASTLKNPASEETQEQEIDISDKNAEPSIEDENQETTINTDTNSDAETDTTVSDVTSGISIALESEEKYLVTESGITYLSLYCTYPIVSIEGNEDAAAKINEDIRSHVEPFMSDTYEWLTNDLQYLLEDDPELTDTYYTAEKSYRVARADDKVISFAVVTYEYLGGAHGMPVSSSYNYDTKTGELIAFDELSDNPDSFHADTLAYNQKLAATEAYSERMFSSDDITNGTLENVLYDDGTWCLATYGLVFVSDPYLLGPYAAGAIEFIIPYYALADMGLKEDYAYTDRQIVSVQEQEPYSIDINGDGDEDSIQFYSEYTADENGNYNLSVHLIINDVDFGQSGDDELKEIMSQYLSDGFFLYDLNVDDDYLELVFLTGEMQKNYYVGYSNFYRYTKDGSLIYLGRVQGDVPDPTLSYFELENDNE